MSVLQHSPGAHLIKDVKCVKKWIRIFALAMVFVFAFGSVGYAADISDLSDVPENAWYEAELEYAVENGIIKGIPWGFGEWATLRFSPNISMSRANFVTMLGRALDGGGVTGDKFTDVPASDTCTPYVYWAVEHGIVKGTTDTTFEPWKSIKRQDAATIIWRMVSSFGFTLPTDEAAVEAFHDFDSVSDYAKESVDMLRQAGILKGDLNQNVNPHASITRAESMAMLVRTLWDIGYEVDMWRGLDTREGFVGRLRIPDVDIDVAVFDWTKTEKTTQEIADEYDSAVLFYYGEHMVIGDHAGQTFSVLNKVVENETIAYLNNNGAKETYCCVETGYGQYLYGDLYDSSGNLIKTRTATGLFTYCCDVNNANGIFYAFWTLVT